VIRHFQLCMPYGVRGISDGILIGRHETTAHRLGRGRRGGKPDGGVCPATGGHPAPRQERILSRARMTVFRRRLTASISWVCGQLFSSLFFIDFHRTNFSDSAGPFTSFDPVGFAIFATHAQNRRLRGCRL
jgi:hypothetical protein